MKTIAVCQDCFLQITEFIEEAGAIGGIQAKQGGLPNHFRVVEAQAQYKRRTRPNSAFDMTRRSQSGEMEMFGSKKMKIKTKRFAMHTGKDAIMVDDDKMDQLGQSLELTNIKEVSNIEQETPPTKKQKGAKTSKKPSKNRE